MGGVSPLVRPEALAAALDVSGASRAGPGGPPVVLDVRWRLGGPAGLDDHLAAHVPGAVFLDLETVLAAPPGAGGRHPLPDPDVLGRSLSEAGVGDGSTVVVYDDADGSVAARGWWLLRWLGFAPDRVAVLDGGWAAWRAGGHPESTGPTARTAAGSGLTVRPGSMPVLEADAAARLVHDGVLLDARAAPRYRGDTEPVDPRAGHIPGARNAPFPEHLGPDGFWRPPEELARRFADLGVTAAGPVGAYCGSGVTACSVVLALEYCGLRDPSRPAALYAGSWSQWSSDPARPVALGPTPQGEP
jgi:thiosulfate/3-mercaptopyruvate sulfurtransferase